MTPVSKRNLVIGTIGILILLILVNLAFSNKSDAEHLLLTPLIKEGSISEAQRKAKVDPTLFNGIESYSGYLTVNSSTNSNLWFWYFPPLNQNNTADVLLWLQGGPGASSLYGLFTENGPFQIGDNLTLVNNPYTWNTNYHLIYIDNPVGTGFSFADDDGYAKSQVDVGNDLYEAMIQFIQLFPHLKSNRLFLTGESYAGKFVPALAYKILQTEKKCYRSKDNGCELKVNLSGLMINSGTPDPYNQIDYGDYLYQIGLIDDYQRKRQQSLFALFRKHADQQLWVNATLIKNEILDMFECFTGFSSSFNYLFNEYQLNNNWIKFIDRAEIKSALHVGQLPFQPRSHAVKQYLFEDYSKSVAPWISTLLSHYPIMFYNGQLDLTAPYTLLVKFIEQLGFISEDEYRESPRCRWYADGELAGFYKRAGKLTEVLVRDSGHMVPKEKPKWALDLITKFVNGHLNCMDEKNTCRGSFETKYIGSSKR